VIVTVHPPSESANIAGGALIGVGAAVGVAGLAGVLVFAMLAARTRSEPACSDGQATDGRDGGYTCGLGESIAGALALLSGMRNAEAGAHLARRPGPWRPEAEDREPPHRSLLIDADRTSCRGHTRGEHQAFSEAKHGAHPGILA
jgi:hypothetical protein